MKKNRTRLNARGEPFQPGDLILDKYMPDASPEQREEARENLKRLAALIVKIEKRRFQEWKAERLKESPYPPKLESSNPLGSQENQQTDLGL